ncbi:NAD(P)-dependent alcohol dehydrogenase [Chitinophaga rhizosphaerae]|uniref:NAD(P)-dependent alcohol dehydrogenase n=1 Tax=Chitinophaga rhizosphaerae TaxID=1864947 RepID=UPI000F80B01A|nr:NAD(P)-dependent alcohol dehydrogenase [Chitinophaga rhizosphaerae]
MKAICYHRYGSPDQLQMQEVPVPVPKDDEVLVKVHASSINSWDWDLLLGKPFLVRLIGGLRKPRRPVLGADVAGTVEAVGNNVSDFRPGDEVFGDIAESGFGGFAEYVVTKEKLLARKSPAMSFAQAAALPQAGLLALQGLRHFGPVKPGQRILLNGAGGGVGTLALQYAKSIGTEVTCVDLASKFDMLRGLGADHCIDYTAADYTRTGEQYDKVLDVIAHRSVADYKRALRPGGTFSMIGGSMGWLLFQMMVLSTLISAGSGRKLGIMGYRPNREDLDQLSHLFEAGQLQAVIDREYPLAETADAFRYFGTGKVMGKIIIAVS